MGKIGQRIVIASLLCVFWTSDSAGFEIAGYQVETGVRGGIVSPFGDWSHLDAGFHLGGQGFVEAKDLIPATPLRIGLNLAYNQSSGKRAGVKLGGWGNIATFKYQASVIEIIPMLRYVHADELLPGVKFFFQGGLGLYLEKMTVKTVNQLGPISTSFSGSDSETEIGLTLGGGAIFRNIEFGFNYHTEDYLTFTAGYNF